MTEKEYLTDEILKAFQTVRRTRPLVHMIGSAVTSALCADAISAVGGRPLMAQAEEEMEEITSSADGLVVNLGQPSAEKYRACETALKTAAAHGIPTVMDPVGVGASGFRKNAAAGLASIPWSGIIKGNSSEIHTVLTGAMAHSGVDSIGSFSHEEESGEFLDRMQSGKREIVMAETGSVDKILWKDRTCGKVRLIRLKHDSERPVILVGSGCVAGAVMGTLLAGKRKESQVRLSSGEIAAAALAAVSMVSFCGESAGDCGYGTYKTTVLDALSRPDVEKYRAYLSGNMEI